MNTIHSLVVALMALGVAPLACAQSTATPAGSAPAPATQRGYERRVVTPFEAVHVSGPIDVELKAADREGVLVRAEDGVPPLIETRVIEGERATLDIRVRDGASFRSSEPLVVVVEFRKLSELVMKGSGNARADRIATSDFALSMSGSGNVRIDRLEAARFAAVLGGSGNLTVAGGRAEVQAYRLSGSGDVDAGKLEGRQVLVAVAGSGDASVHATETLDVTIAGSGNVSYRGSPRVTQRIRGSGSLQRLH